MSLSGFIKKTAHSLKFHMLLPVCAITAGLIVFLTCSVSIKYTGKLLEKETEKTQAAFSVAAGSVLSALNNLAESAVSTALTDSVTYYARRGYATSMPGLVKAGQNMLSAVESTIDRQNGLYGLIFIRTDGTCFGSISMRRLMDTNNWGVFSAFVNQIPQNGITWLPLCQAKEILGDLTALDGVSGRFPEKFLVGLKRITGVNHIQGAMLIVDPVYFENYLKYLVDGSSRIYLLNSQNETLASAGEQLPSPSFSAEQNNSDYYLISIEIGIDNWRLVRQIPMNDYLSDRMELQLFIWLAAGLLFAFFLLLYIRWLNIFMRTFNSLKNGIIAIGSGHLGISLNQPYKISEFESIRGEFNQMNTALISLLNTTKEMEREKIELQMRALQTQLSPHMIFNSMTAIRWMASMMGADKVADMMLELSEMLRPVLREWRVEWTIEEEINHLRHYGRLLDLRFGNRFNLTIDTDESLKSQLIPRFTLQPIVENACEHGGIGSETLHVGITLSKTDSGIQIIADNDGESVPDEKLQEINLHLHEPSENHHIGLKNVYQRLLICFGNSAKMHLENLNPHGIRVSISWQPVEKSFQNNKTS